MDNRIGIGMLVGLATFSSIYIWNSKNFSKTQKVILLLCIVFPPLQWGLMGIIYVYNKYVYNTKTTNNDDKNSLGYIVLIIVIFILIGFIILNNTDKTSGFELPENNYESNESDTYIEPSPTVTKYAYVVIEADIPELEIIKGFKKTGTNMFESEYVEDSYYTTYKKVNYISEIVEIKDYSIDNENRILDNFEKTINNKLSAEDYNYEMKLMIDCKDENRETELKKNKSKITFRQVLSFDTYSAASINRRNKEQYIPSESIY